MPFNLFGKKKEVAPPPVDVNTAIEKQKRILDAMEKRYSYLEKQKTTQTEEARRYIQQGNKRSAMSSLKRRKMIEQQLAQLDGTRHNLETQMNALQNCAFQSELVSAFVEGANVLKAVNVDVEDVHDKIDEARDIMERAQETADALAQPLFDTGYGYGDDDLMDELNQLSEEVATTELMGLTDTSSKFKSPATSQPAAPQPSKSLTESAAVDDELNRLKELLA
ncbi:hypothetical protein RCL1_002551 [Eukaryota sp. TZLM3-RCL]